MATTTTNFGWDIPQSTDLVKDGATAIAALGQDIDTAMVDLKGGTTGQVLAKASGTDLDFSWVAQDDSNAIQNAIVDAKGDLIGATAADTPARLAVGTNGQVLTADSAEATGLKWTTVPAGLTLVKSQTIGSAVTSVTVTSAFSSTYDNYLITIDGGTASGDAGLFMTLGSTTTGYYKFEIYGSYSSNTVNGFGGSNGASWGDAGNASTNSINGQINLFDPNDTLQNFLNFMLIIAAIIIVYKRNFNNDMINYIIYSIIILNILRFYFVFFAQPQLMGVGFHNITKITMVIMFFLSVYIIKKIFF
jgi:hypothetical protein